MKAICRPSGDQAGPAPLPIAAPGSPAAADRTTIRVASGCPTTTATRADAGTVGEGAEVGPGLMDAAGVNEEFGPVHELEPGVAAGPPQPAIEAATARPTTRATIARAQASVR